ncbi:hypothetical protein [Yersinia enterocolitica]
MEVEYLLVIPSREGEIITKEKLTEKIPMSKVISAKKLGDPSSIGVSHDVKKHPYRDKVYAIVIGKNTDNHEIERLIESSGVKLIPTSLLK